MNARQKAKYYKKKYERILAEPSPVIIHHQPLREYTIKKCIPTYNSFSSEERKFFLANRIMGRELLDLIQKNIETKEVNELHDFSLFDRPILEGKFSFWIKED